MDTTMKNPEFQKIYNYISRTTNAGAEAEDAAGEVLGYLEGKKVLIYPAGALGRLLERTLRHYGIMVEAFIDRAADEMSEIDNIPVYEPNLLSSADEQAVVFITVNSVSLAETLADAVKKINPHIRVMDGFLLNRILKYSLCQRQLDSKRPFDIVLCENCGHEERGCILFSAYLQRVAPGKRHDEVWRSRTFNWFGYLISQKCTLKCRHCCESIPYLPNSGFVPCDMVIKDIQKVAESCEFLKFVYFIGGEPFLHPEIEEILTRLLKVENIGYIKSFTNGTIIPSDSLCEILKNPRFMLTVSNYERILTGTLKERFFTTRRKLEERGIHYVYNPQLEWRDFSSFEPYEDPIHSLKDRYENCSLSHYRRLHKGILYHCAHQYAGIQLGKLMQHSHECVKIHEYTQKDLAVALEKFDKLPFIDACRYCAMPYDAKIVTPGEQITENCSNKISRSHG
jgi:hypothetical protein